MTTGKTRTFYLDANTERIIADHQVQANAANASAALRELIHAANKTDASKQIAWLRQQLDRAHQDLEDAHEQVTRLSDQLAKARRESQRVKAITDSEPSLAQEVAKRMSKNELQALVPILKTPERYLEVLERMAKAEEKGLVRDAVVSEAPLPVLCELAQEVGGWTEARNVVIRAVEEKEAEA